MVLFGIFSFVWSLRAGMLRAFVATWGHKAICASLDIKIFQSSLYLISAFHSPFLLSGHKFTSPGARCTFFTRGIKIINNSSLLLVSRLWIIHHTIPAGYCLLLICLILLLCWGEGNLVPYLQNRSHFISYLVSVFVSSADNWNHFLGGITPRSRGSRWRRLFTYVFAWMCPSSFFHLKVTFLSSTSEALQLIGWTRWYVQAFINGCAKNPSSHVISIKWGRKKKRQKVVTPDQWVVSLLPSVPDSNGAPPCCAASLASSKRRRQGGDRNPFFISARAFVS